MPLYLDFETYSTIDLKKKGLYNYARHPSTGVWCLGYAFDDGLTQLWFGNQPPPMDVYDYIRSGGEVVAHNAPFELNIWNNIMTGRHEAPELSPDQVTCTMARCYAMSLPGALENAAPALGLPVDKDMEGHALMLRMCKPETWRHDRPVYLPALKESFTFLGEKRTGAWALQRLGEYCARDVDVERAVYKRTLPLSAYERKLWRVDYDINQRGVPFDMDEVNAALAMRDTVLEVLDQRMNELTGGDVAVCSAIPALKTWLADHGILPESLNKAAVGELIDAGLPDNIRRVLETRREAGRATSVKKLDAIENLAGPDGRVRNLFQYHGAGTGRWAGRAVQPHNLPRDLPEPAVVEEMMAMIRSGDHELLSAVHDMPLNVISKLIRAFIKAPEGSQLIGGDWSSVEGRGIAWLAGEEWKLEAFRESDADPDTPDMYERSYAAVFGIRPEEVTKAQRQIGKVQELAFGYQGGVGAFHSMAEVYGVHVPDEEADYAKVLWREAHPRIKSYWYQLQDAALNAVRSPGVITTAGPYDRQVKFRKAGSFLWMLLPSGRALCYPYPEIRDGLYGDMLTYKSVPSQDDKKKKRIIDDPTNTPTWARLSTYGGKLAENATQAICRDFLADAILRCEAASLPIVFHVHDEPVAEVTAGLPEDLWKFEEIMNTPPKWAADFPLTAECWMNRRYIK